MKKQKKSNYITMLLFILFAAAAIIFMIFKEKPSASYSEEDISETMIFQEDTGSETVISRTENTTEMMEPKRTDNEEDTIEPKRTDEGEDTLSETNVLPENALFIGDSRTVGLMEYGGMNGVDFYANVGMSLYNMHKKPLSVPGVGKVTLTELLENKRYSRIYVMLGVNELGYDFDRTTDRYKELIAFIRERQPEARLFLQANLHVAKSRSDSDKVINNKAIDRRNAAIAELSDNREIFYLDANVLFDDGSGNLAAEKNADTVHLYAKYYAEWADWIEKQSGLTAGED